MKKTVSIVLCLVIALSLTGCFVSPEKRVMNYYNKHITEFKDNIACHFEKREPLSFPARGVIVTEWVGAHTIVEYIVEGTGIAPSSRYYGFFYSRDNIPVSFQNSGEEMVSKSDIEWEWHGVGDNRGYVKQIEPYWFYFEASF